MSALQVGVGRLGVITEVELMIKPQSMITRQGVNVTWPQFLDSIKELQANWTGAVAGTNGLTTSEVQNVWEATQVWQVLRGMPERCNRREVCGLEKYRTIIGLEW